MEVLKSLQQNGDLQKIYTKEKAFWNKHMLLNITRTISTNYNTREYHKPEDHTVITNHPSIVYLAFL